MSAGDKLKGKAEELAGRVKAGVGAATGDTGMEASGHVDHAEGAAKSAAADRQGRIEGAGDRLKGRVKGAAGALTGNDRLEAEGKGDTIKGALKEKLHGK